MSKLLLALAAIAALGAASTALVRLKASARERAAEAAFPPLGKIVDIEGVPLHLHVEGSGPPVIVIHGAGANMRDHEDIAAALRDRFTVVRFDRPGLGHSGLPPAYGKVWKDRSFGPTEQARLLAQAYDQLDLGPAVILGHSYGTAVALAWALERPEQAAALVPLAGVSHPWDTPPSTVHQSQGHPLGAAFLVPLNTAFAGPKQIQPVLDAIFAPQATPADYGDRLGVGLSIRRSQLRANARQVRDLSGHLAEMAPRYGSLTLPVEIIHGDVDPIVPFSVHAEALANDLPNAQLTPLPGIGHMPQYFSLDEIIAGVERAAARAGLRPAAPSGTMEP